MDKLITKQHLLFLVIGGFSILLTAEFAFFLGHITHQLFIITNQNPLYTIIAKEIVQLIVFIISVFIILKLITKQKVLNQKHLKRQIIWLIAIYFIIQILQVLYNLYGISAFEGYNDKIKSYSEFIKENYLILISSSIVYYLQLIFFAFIIINYSIKDDK
ncbi:hypothetical protein HNV10_02500 [Winogradskyella litoriviva]|uniref:DUF4149 domain-containing protein n=1 Tax=Winogradskyella litoriviva TaxID=1220182 RepID=A0ABX2E0R4_9FLAO|nr:hypothetical protein [Winogradskyella litoriviva]NRD22093.1 hypothetical protein [Winogradskyella litoriviva]